MITLTCVTFQTSVQTYDGSLFLLHHLVVFLFIFIHCHCGVIVKTLSHKLQCQRVLLSGGLFDLGPFILEPNFDLILVQLQLARQILAALLRQVAVLRELAF